MAYYIFVHNLSALFDYKKINKEFIKIHSHREHSNKTLSKHGIDRREKESYVSIPCHWDTYHLYLTAYDICQVLYKHKLRIITISMISSGFSKEWNNVRLLDLLNELSYHIKNEDKGDFENESDV